MWGAVRRSVGRHRPHDLTVVDGIVHAYAGGLTPAAWLEGPGTVLFDDMMNLPALVAAA